MNFCEHGNLTVDIVDESLDSGHLVSCNACGRWWRYHMDWRVAWEHFNGCERSEAYGTAPETIRVDCSR